jgi:hypothetical protein
MKTNMNIDTELEKLRKIRRVDAPPFLYTRIEQSLDSASRSSVSPKLRFAVFSSLLALAIINGIVLSSGSGQETQQSGIRHLASEMNLQSSNDLYE